MQRTADADADADTVVTAIALPVLLGKLLNLHTYFVGDALEDS